MTLTSKEIEHVNKFFKVEQLMRAKPADMEALVAIRTAFIEAETDEAKRVVLKQFIADHVLPALLVQQSKISASKTIVDDEVTYLQNYIS